MNIDVIVLTYGEPHVNTFWEQWKYSNNILFRLTRIVAPIPRIAVPLIGAWRGLTRVRSWKKLGYRSPLEPITEDQKAGIEAYLKANSPGHKWRVRLAYEFRDPMLIDMLQHLTRWQSDLLIFVPIYLAVSDFTNFVSARDFLAFQKKHKNALPWPHTIMFRPHLHDLADIVADHIAGQVHRRLVHENPNEFALLLGCHGTLVNPPKGIKDTGYKDTIKMYQLLRDRLAPKFKDIGIGWLNHVLGGEWTSPTLHQTIEEMQAKGIHKFVYYPFGFLADNAETQLEGRQAMEDCGVGHYHHIPCINENPKFLEFVSKLILKKAGLEIHKQEPEQVAV